MDTRDLVDNNLKFYDSIKPKNPQNSYTVLATLNDYHSKELLCLATGTQANLKLYDDDIQDCHAESLVKRAFKRYIIDSLRHSSTGELQAKKPQSMCSQLPSDVILFVSKFPCGFVSRYQGQEPVDSRTGDVIKRKPGRGTEREGKIVYVEKDSCYEKVNKWLETGIQGTSLRRDFGIETRIKMIVIGTCESDVDIDYKAQLQEFNLRLSSGSAPIDLEICEIDYGRKDEFIFRPDRQAQPVSLVWWRHAALGSPFASNNNCEMIVDGRRRGLTKQHLTNGIRAGSRLKVADACLREDLECLKRGFQMTETHLTQTS